MFMLKSTHEKLIEEKNGDIDWWCNEAHRAEDRLKVEREAGRQKGRALSEALAERDALQARLDRIAALETPNCAHIGKKMAAIARGDEK